MNASVLWFHVTAQHERTGLNCFCVADLDADQNVRKFRNVYNIGGEAVLMQTNEG